LHKFENTYLYGAFSPINGNTLLVELPECNTDWFEAFLNELSAIDKDEFKILILDNGVFHKAKRLQIPENIVFVFLPPYSPELNPAERIWLEVKRHLKLKVFRTLKELQVEIDYIVNNLITIEKVKSITAYDFYIKQYQTIFN
jgi:transposase